MSLYNNIFNDLREMILSKKFYEGDVFYSEKEIMENYGVSRITARKAMDRLENEGLIKKSSGKPTIVKSNKEILQIKVYGGFSRDNFYHNVTSKLIDLSTIIPNEKIKSELNLNNDDKVYRLVRQRFIKGEIYGLNIAYIPLKFIRLTKDDFYDCYSSLYKIFEENGIIVNNAKESIEAIKSDKDTALILSVEEDSPLLYIERLTMDRKNNIVEYVEIFYKSDKYKYEVNLSEIN